MRLGCLVAICLTASTARADQVSFNLEFAQGLLLPECNRGYADACLELITWIETWLEHDPPERVAIHYVRHLVPPCKDGFAPACEALVRMAGEMAFGARGQPPARGRVAGDAALQVLEDGCRVGSPRACEVTAELGHALLNVPARAERRRGRVMLRGACLGGHRQACASLQAVGEPTPFGADDRLMGAILSYSGLGVTLGSAAVWALAFSEGRCGTRGLGRDRSTLVGLCTFSTLGYALGTAVSILGTQLSLNGTAQGLVGDANVTGSSWFFWLGAGVSVAGGLVPLGIEIAQKEWWEPMAWSPLIFGALGQSLLLVARWVVPSLRDEDGYRIAPVALPVGDPGSGSALGASFSANL